MSIEYESRKILDGVYLRLADSSAYRERFGLLNTRSREKIDPENTRELTEAAADIDYNGSLSLRDHAIARFYGGAIKTPHGTKTWSGKTPEDVRKFVEQIESSI